MLWPGRVGVGLPDQIVIPSWTTTVSPRGEIPKNEIAMSVCPSFRTPPALPRSGTAISLAAVNITTRDQSASATADLRLDAGARSSVKRRSLASSLPAPPTCSPDPSTSPPIRRRWSTSSWVGTGGRSTPGGATG